jgi:predicted AlkP superfamily phosphohydrolase/phosphomutase
MIPWLIAAGLSVNLTALLATRSLSLAARWGALWGCALGWWLLAAPLLDAQPIGAQGIRDRVWITILLSAVFSVLGIAVVFCFGGLLAIPVRHPGARSRHLRYALLTPALLVVGYGVGSAAMEWLLLGTVSAPAGTQRQLLVAAAVAVAATGGIAWLAGRQSMRTAFAPSRVAAAVAVIAVAGMAFVRVPAPRVTVAAPHQDSDEPPAARRPGAGQAPLLVVGLDSGNWATLRPAIASGRLPLFKRLYETGASGRVRAQWPPYWSAPAWAAILTGFGRDETRVHEDLVAAVPGLHPFEIRLTTDLRLNPIALLQHMLMRAGALEAAPHHRSFLAQVPIWERLARHRVRTAVIRFPFTHPAAGQAAYVISNRIDAEGWESLGVRPGARADAVFPSSVADDMHSLFTASDPNEAPLLQSIAPELGGPNPRDARTELLPIMRSVLATDRRTFAAARKVLEIDRGLDVLMLYVGGFDVVCHAFWPYRFPDDYRLDPPDAHDVRRFGTTIDRYLEYIDRELQNVVDAFDMPPNVLIVSDHGHEASSTATLWRAWHGAEGMLLTAGPDVKARSTELEASYLDVAPTILALLGLPIPSRLGGRALLPHREGQ